jgi:hypothetical protein
MFKLFDLVIGGILTEAKTSPWLAFTAISFWVGVWASILLIYPTLAQTGDLQNVKQDVAVVSSKLDMILANQLVEKMRVLRRERCLAADQDIRARRNTEIETIQAQYRSLTSERWPLPNCTEYL